jgi:hypothetical protein
VRTEAVAEGDRLLARATIREQQGKSFQVTEKVTRGETGARA